MPYKLVWEEKGVYWKYNGKVTGEEILEASSKIYGDSRFDEIDYKYVDFSDAEEISITEDLLMLIAYQHRAAELSNPRVTNVIVVDENCGLANQFAKFFEESKWTIKIFKTRSDAEEFLGSSGINKM